MASILETIKKGISALGQAPTKPPTPQDTLKKKGYKFEKTSGMYDGKKYDKITAPDGKEFQGSFADTDTENPVVWAQRHSEGK